MTAWQESLFEVLKTSGVKLVTYVPDAGHAHLISRAHQDEAMRAVVLRPKKKVSRLLAALRSSASVRSC